MADAPIFIDAEKCVGCGICAEKCPRKIIDVSMVKKDESETV